MSNFFSTLLSDISATCAIAAPIAATLNPVSVLYGLLAGTYGSAAIAAKANDHHALARCYLASAVLHELIGIAHHMGL